MTGPKGRRLDFERATVGDGGVGAVLGKRIDRDGDNRGSNIKRTEEDLIMFAPAYNNTRKEVERIVEIFVESLDEVLRGSESV